MIIAMVVTLALARPAPIAVAQTPAQSWLDRPLAGWNKAGAPLPAPPRDQIGRLKPA